MGRAREVDLALAENDLLYSDLAESQTIRCAEADGSPLTGLDQRFGVALRRVSVSLGEPEKLNLYYVLTSVD